jgi:hypothetical protein
MTRSKVVLSLISSAALLAFAGCHTTVVQPAQPAAAQPAPQHYDDHHDDHHPPPPPPDHRDDHR